MILLEAATTVATAKDDDVGLIAMATHGGGEVAWWTLGSVAGGVGGKPTDTLNQGAPLFCHPLGLPLRLPLFFQRSTPTQLLAAAASCSSG